MLTLSRFLQKYWADLAAILLVLVGLTLRLRQYLSGRSFWLDEAMLALNIVGRDFAGLLQPLDYDQGAPLGFLFVEKTTISILQNGELTLRLPPFIAGCLALVLFYLLLRRFLSPAGMLPALAFFAFSERLIYYTSELKQYIFDVFILLALLLVFLYARPKQDEESTPGRAWIPLLLVGILAVWFSHPSVFILSGIGLTLLWQNRRNRRQFIQVGLVILGWLVSFGGVFLASLNSLAANDFLMDYWQDYFMPMPPWSDPARYLDVLSHATTYFGLTVPDWLALAIALGGFVALWRFHAPLASVFGLALLTAFGVSALGKYPLGGRMLLFIAPISMGLFGAAFEGLYRLLRLARLRWGAAMVIAALATLLLLAPVSLAVERFQSPRMQSNMHPALSGLRQKYQPDDLIYIYPWAEPAFRYYAPFYGFAGHQFTSGQADPPQPLVDTLTDIEDLRDNPRVWILFSHVLEKDGINEQESILAYIDSQELGKCRIESREPGTSVLLLLCNFSP
jgi:hypothetical protein